MNYDWRATLTRNWSEIISHAFSLRNGYQPHVTSHFIACGEYIIPLRLCFVQAFNVGEAEKMQGFKGIEMVLFHC